jgi:hypothetical protein
MRFTGTDGQAIFTDIPTGDYIIHYEEDQFHIPNGDYPTVFAYTASLSVASDVTLTLELQPLPKLTVTVTNAITGNPIANAEVLMDRVHIHIDRFTDSDGKVVIDTSNPADTGCYPGHYGVHVKASN